MHRSFRTPFDATNHVDESTAHAFDGGMSQRRLNDFLDVMGRRFGLPRLQSQASPGAGITLENGDAVYFRSNGTLDSFDLYFRIDVPPSMLNQPDLIHLIIKNCFSGDKPPPVLFIQEREGFLLFGLTDIEYGESPETSEHRINVCFSEYITLIEFLRNEVH
ncbi:hypothetical protein [Pandoraea anhela]|uniref:Uncharacterized protein n=1 Tax=Pandoraea anhela TaxID=2508295 RepID=A0A5E4SWK6_9BURK|nr:hypothetical protein [Pandoraea anhela]VVD79422.1 hypothetical protein PAN31108_01029 [Pandoraea anhela]